eukprot:12883035-Ditylum_brightwellii.AAC.1
MEKQDDGICHDCNAKASVEGRDTLEGTKGKLRNRVIRVKDIPGSGDTTQHKEEYGEDEEGYPNIISEIRDDKDSGEECGKEGEVEVGNSKKDASEAPLSKVKRRE